MFEVEGQLAMPSTLLYSYTACEFEVCAVLTSKLYITFDKFQLSQGHSYSLHLII